MTGPPRYYLRNCHTIVRPYGWLSYLGLAGELHELDCDVYGHISAAQAAHWLIDLGVPVTVQRFEDGEDVPGVAFYDIDDEINQRQRQVARRRFFRKLTRL